MDKQDFYDILEILNWIIITIFLAIMIGNVTKLMIDNV